jgi:hypothetical protein
VHDAQIFSLERDRQGIEKLRNPLPLLGTRERCLAELRVELRIRVRVEPMVAVLDLPSEDVQLVVPENALGSFGFDEHLHEPHDARTVRPAIAEVADEYEASAAGVLAVLVAQPSKQGAEGVELSVYVTDDV